MSIPQMQNLGHKKATKNVVGTNIVPIKKVLAEGDYIIALANSGTDVYVMACYNFNSGGKNNWFDIPATGHNCNADCQTCIDNRNFEAIAQVNCAEARINLTIATQPDAQGYANIASFDVAISCDAAGGVLCV
jgi:hypothetical protein